jgi:hypothetical protein
MSLILENQAKQLVVETSQVDGGTAAFTPGTGNNWAGIALPLVRKVFGQIAAKEFVSVQPMNLPSGLVFYLDFQYGKLRIQLLTLLLTSTLLVNQFTVTKLLLSTHSLQLIQLMVVVSTVLVDLLTHSLLKVLNSVSFTAATASWKDVGFDSALSASVAAGEILKLLSANLPSSK